MFGTWVSLSILVLTSGWAGPGAFDVPAAQSDIVGCPGQIGMGPVQPEISPAPIDVGQMQLTIGRTQLDFNLVQFDDRLVQFAGSTPSQRPQFPLSATIELTPQEGAQLLPPYIPRDGDFRMIPPYTANSAHFWLVAEHSGASGPSAQQPSPGR